MSETDDDFVPRPPKRTGPFLAVIGLVAVLVAWNLWPRAYEVVDCGRIDAQTDVATLPDEAFCTLQGTVTGDLVLSMGRTVDSDTPARKYAGVRFFARLGDANVFALLPGHREDVAGLYHREEKLTGFEVEGMGRIFDPDPLPGYGGTAKGIRKFYGLEADAPVRLFDTEEKPPE